MDADPTQAGLKFRPLRRKLCGNASSLMRKSIMRASSRASTSGSEGRCAISTRTRSRRMSRSGSRQVSAKPARNSSNGCETRRRTSSGCDTSASIGGASRSSPTATSAMSRAAFRTASGSVCPSRPSSSARFICDSLRGPGTYNLGFLKKQRKHIRQLWEGIA